MASYQQQIEKAREKRELYEEKIRAHRAEQTYRAIDENNNRHKRRTPQIEFQGEDDEFAGLGRLKAIAKSRDLRRNYGGAKALETQLKLNVVGTAPKIIMQTGNEKRDEEWTRWFNKQFAKHCDGRGNRHLACQSRISLASVIREGHILCFFDRYGVIPGGEGQFWYWEADQMPSLNNVDWKNHKTEINKRLGVDGRRTKIDQHYGQIVDKYGRTLGYIVTANPEARGMPEVRWSEVTILPADDCNLLYNPWRINQKLGTSDMIEVANQFQDIERFGDAMLQRAICQSYFAMKAKKKEGAIEGRDRVYQSEGNDGAPAVTDGEHDSASSKRYRNFEKLSMNAFEYMEPDEDVESMELGGDLPDSETFIDFMQRTGGWSMGLANVYATGKANSSYSASMQEANMSWRVFHFWQWFVQNYDLDWKANKALEWAQKTGRITQASTDSEWRENWDWTGWPERKAINPGQEANAKRTLLEIGDINYEDLHGPYWPQKLEKLGRQIRHSRDNGFFSPSFKPQAGGGSNE